MARSAQLVVEVLTETRKAADGVSKISKTFGAVSKAAGALGIALGAAQIGRQVLDFAKDSVQAASDTQQAMGAVESVFKGNAAVIKKWSKGAATNLGIPAAEAAQMAAILGSQLKGMGLSLDQSTSKTQDLVKVAADLAATYGGTTADAITAVSALLRGERDPIEKYGVAIKDADVKAQMAAMGLDKLTGSAKTQATAQATLALLMAKSTDAAGAFGRETDTLAHQQQVANAKFMDAKAALGSALLPAVAAVTSWIANKLIPAVMSAWTWFKSMAATIKGVLGPAFNYAKTSIAAMWAALNKLGITSGTVKTVLKALAILVGGTLVVSIAAAALVFGTMARMMQATASGVATLVGWVRDLVGWLGRIRVPTLNWPKPPSWLSKLTGGALTAPAAAPTVGARAAAPGARASSAGIVINISGALDPEGVARQVRRILTASDSRGGRTGVLQPVGAV